LKALMTGSIVSVSILLPLNAATVSGNPVASVSSPTVICGSRRRSLELCRGSGYAEVVVAVVVFVLLRGFGGGDPRGITAVMGLALTVFRGSS
jgi:hypothetical protein